MNAGDLITNIIAWGVFLVPIVIFLLGLYDAVFNGVSYNITSEERKQMEEWHKTITLTGDPTPWDDNHYR